MKSLKLVTPCADEHVHLLERRLVDIGDDGVEGVVDGADAVGLLLPGVDAGRQ